VSMTGAGRYVADLLRGRRPRRFDVTPEDAAELRAAILLRAATPGATEPSDEFVEALRQRLAGDEPPARPRRRAVVRGAAIAAGAAALGVGGDRLLWGDTVVAQPQPDQRLDPNDGVWRTVVATDDLPEGGVVPFDLGAVVGFVQRSGGQLRAVSGVCTHLGCRLLLDSPARRLNCPCHRTAFTTTGEVIFHQLPATPPPLPSISVRESGGNVQVLVPPASQ
jgi:cytochrome b6-f complex iron-sulfur subunit